MAKTMSTEDCLEAITQLTREEGHAHVSDIAKRLGITKPSVVTTLKKLAGRGLIRYEAYQPVELTSKGGEIAGKVIRKHETLRRFLTQHLELGEKHANDLACRLEHELDDVAFDRLQNFVNIKTLDDLKAKENAVVVDIAPVLNYQRFASYGLVKGARIALSKVAPLGDPRSFDVDGTEVSLRASEANHIMVQILNEIPKKQEK